MIGGDETPAIPAGAAEAIEAATKAATPAQLAAVAAAAAGNAKTNNKKPQNNKNPFKNSKKPDRAKQQRKMDEDYKKGKTDLAKKTIIDMHKRGELGDFIDKIISQFGIYITIIGMILVAPSMPILFYLTILYNVLIVTWENFKALDTDNIK